MLDFLRYGLAALLTLAGLLVLISGVAGVFRFRYALNRIHAAALNDTLGLGLMLLGMAVAEGFSAIAFKLLFVVIFLWLTSPVASHLIGRLETATNEELDKKMTVTDKEALAREKEGD